MMAIKAMSCIVAVAMAMTITLSLRSIIVDVLRNSSSQITAARAVTRNVRSSEEVRETLPKPLVPSRKMSRFLAGNKNPRAADHCRKDNEICYDMMLTGQNSTCCSNKCVDLSTDAHNCGACKNKCSYTHTCCGGECVNLSNDEKHCGACDRRCIPRGFCFNGMCDYA